MKAETAQSIVKIYNEAEEEFDEHSTAFILEVVAERVRMAQIIKNCDVGHVVDALIQEGVYK